jgi:hypothetical protein
MAMLDLVDDGGQFAAEALAQPDAEDLADAVGVSRPALCRAMRAGKFIAGAFPCMVIESSSATRTISSSIAPRLSPSRIQPLKLGCRARADSLPARATARAFSRVLFPEPLSPVKTVHPP